MAGLVLSLSCAGGFQLLPRDLGSGSVFWSSFRNSPTNVAVVEKDFPPPSKLLWRFKTGAGITTTPLVRGDMVILSSWDKKLYFLDSRTGAKKTELQLRSPVASTPCLVQEILYFGTAKNDKKLYAFNYVSGRMVWETKAGETSSPLLATGGRLLAGNSDGNLVCLDRMTGAELWRFKTAEPIISAPAVADNQVYFGSWDGRLYCANLTDGSQHWKFETKAGIQGSVALEGGRVYFGSLDSNLYCLSGEGKELWHFQARGAIYGSPAVDSEKVYFGANDGTFYCLDKKKGELIWKHETGSLIHSSPIAVGKWVSFGSFDRNFYVLDKATGIPVFKYVTEGIISASPSFGKGKYFIAGEDRYLYCFAP